MIEVIRSKEDQIQFKRLNLHHWIENTDYWLHSQLRQVVDTKDFLEKKLHKIVHECHEIPTIVDLGCGSGWIPELLLKSGISCRYIGLDFNEGFISFLQEKHKDHKGFTFRCLDIEEKIPNDLSNSAHIVVNCFNYFELANLDKAFENTRTILKNNGSLIILTIDVIYLLLAISGTMEEYKEHLAQYEHCKENGTGYFFQKIDLGDGPSDLEYASVLYSLQDYLHLAEKNQMKFVEYDEVIKTSKFYPKVYQYLHVSAT